MNLELIQIKVFPPRAFESDDLYFDTWQDYWEVYILFSVDGIPWETSREQTARREGEKYPTPHNLCTVAVGDIAHFPLWISEFMKIKYPAGFARLDFTMNETPTYLKLEKRNPDNK